ncbi:hypothetical protein DPMN_074083 [Dreissena polymorpha]|uniref:Uncharacterized protein n=1 Tax=Dreissena polymorpha TaxID=45954 RepID=A0A9D3YHY7_DREPO|nr:hypothetical protein DPMN_074083 [Dreissena polymorpha]
MPDFTHLVYTTSAQHKDSTEARIKIDASDLEETQTKVKTCLNYTADPTLRSIFNGKVAGLDVNVHAFQEVGNKIIKGIIGKSALAYKLNRVDRAAKTLANSSAVQISKDRAIDSILLFPHLLVVFKSGDLSLDVVLLY